jgi:hypothetical protein
MTPSNDLEVWMQQHQDNYINDFSVQLSRAPEFIFVDAPWPGHPNADNLCIILLKNNAAALFEDLGIETAAELDEVTPEDLLTLFYAGKAIVLCTVKEEASLLFHKDGNTMLALLDGEELGHEVTEQLVVPGDFIRYTQQYFRSFDKYNKKLKNKI